MPTRTVDLESRLAVEDTVIAMFVATDQRDWTALQGCFTDPFTLDMTSIMGGSPASMSPGLVADAWAEGFKSLDHVHHQIGNLQTTIKGRQATVRCYGVAFHHRARVSGLKTRIFVGTYQLQLVGGAENWQISELKFQLKFIDGNLELEKSA
jgi:SnoaL-like domain